jgi:acyl-CoA thioester hydrolase
MNTPVFEYTITVLPEHIDAREHVNNVVYVQFMQDAAGRHWNSKVSKELDAQVIWFVKRHEIDYHNAALLNDQLLVRTWTGANSAVTWDRHYEITRIADNKKIITAKSVWVLLDRETGKPKRIDDSIMKPFIS